MIYPVFVFDRWLNIKIYKHSSALYIMSKICRKINDCKDIPGFAFVNENECIDWKSPGKIHPLNCEITFNYED